MWWLGDPALRFGHVRPSPRTKSFGPIEGRIASGDGDSFEPEWANDGTDCQHRSFVRQPRRRRKIVILGAAGRDFHNLNVVYRDDPTIEWLSLLPKSQASGSAETRHRFHP